MLANEVREIQGLYGPFTLSEKVIQKIWMRQDFDCSALRTSSGKVLRVLDPGRWNFNEGPDFREARIEVDGREIVGDVEVHFRSGDWFAHGHQSNANFGNVVLHVLLIPEPASDRMLSVQGVEALVLMPLLNRDLEEHAMEDALLDLENASQLDCLDSFRAQALTKRREIVHQSALERWHSKLRHAEKRLSAASWSLSCHQCILEVLGYSRNRAAMSRIALKYTIDDFAGADSAMLASIFEASSGLWKLSGLRPANHPKRRLSQYAALCRHDAGWPDALASVLGQQVVPVDQPTSRFRRAAECKAMESSVSDQVFGGQLSSSRLSTLFADAIFPLAHAAKCMDSERHWYHWYPGDMPSSLRRLASELELNDSARPISNGLLQGLLGIVLRKGDLSGLG
ncbi:MAG: DUF2851 family protein [Opitutales bacterium]